VIDDFAKEYLQNDLRIVREAMLWKLDGLSEYDVRRPLTLTGTNLLGLIKHLSITESWYFGDVFGRPFPGPWRRWDEGPHLDSMWVTASESRSEIIDRYRLAWEHSDATIASLDIDSPGHVPWWPRPNVKRMNPLRKNRGSGPSGWFATGLTIGNAHGLISTRVKNLLLRTARRSVEFEGKAESVVDVS
jgi:hypothetical protein